MIFHALRIGHNLRAGAFGGSLEARNGALDRHQMLVHVL